MPGKASLIAIFVLGTMLIFSCSGGLTGPGVTDANYDFESPNRITIRGIGIYEDFNYQVVIFSINPTPADVKNDIGVVASSPGLVLHRGDSHTFWLGSSVYSPWTATGTFYIVVDTDVGCYLYDSPVSFSASNRNPNITLSYSNSTLIEFE